MTYLCLAALAAAFALATPPRAPAEWSGGAGIAPSPSITDVRCLATTARPCVAPRSVQPGGRIAVRGRYVSSASSVVFLGRAGRRDDVVARVRARTRSSVTAGVPNKARSGPIALASSLGTRSRRWSGLVIVTAPQPTDGIQSGPVSVTPSKFFFGALQKAEFTYQPGAGAPTDVIASLVRASDGIVVRNWRQAQVTPGVPAKVAWDGKTAAGRVAAEGLYLFRVAPAATGSAAAGAAVGESTFAFYDHMFPVQGRHDYGSAGSRFGAGRGGRSHQGQDVFATCGTPLVAARAGKVVYSGYHSLAGYYLVIRGDGSGLDYAYMHLQAPAAAKTGDRVYTGQPLGGVGETGNAHGCHLHFELWSAPGWYRGGRAFDPLPELKQWDRAS